MSRAAMRQIFMSLAQTEEAENHRLVRRLVTAGIVVLGLHLLFLLVIAPRMRFAHSIQAPTEVVQITQKELDQLKNQIMKNRHLDPLLKQELHEEFRTKEAPKDARMSGPFNQKVDKEMVAGPQPDVPLDGGGGGAAAAASRPRPRPVRLSALGLGTNVPKPAMEQPQEQQQESSAAGPRGPRAPYRPVGRDDKNLQHGNQNLLNAIESEFYSFFARMEDPIIRNWYFLLRAHDMQMHQEMAGRGVKPGADLPVTVEFVLDRQGNFQSMTVIESSGIPTLDWATKESVRKLGSLPNPPPALFEGSQYFTHRLRFMVHVTDTPVFTTRPDLYY